MIFFCEECGNRLRKWREGTKRLGWVGIMRNKNGEWVGITTNANGEWIKSKGEIAEEFQIYGGIFFECDYCNFLNKLPDFLIPDNFKKWNDTLPLHSKIKNR